MSFRTLIRQSIFDIYRQTYSFNISYVRSRAELPIILNKRGLTGRGAEIGVWKGQFSNFLLSKWKGEKLYSIDPWKSFSSEEYPDDMNINQTEFDGIHNEVKNLLSKFGDRSEIIRKDSVTASKIFEDNFLDFAYLDGRHHYEGVKEDIEFWFPKVKKGGILCGHDYLNTVIGETHFGVKDAVDEFATSNNLKVLVTKKDDYPSWFIIK